MLPTVKARHVFPVVWYYLWLGIFTAQPHKEERFMFVCYPLLCYSAALCLWSLRSFVAYFTSNHLASTFTFGVLLSATLVSMSRIEILKEYNAPLQVYPSLQGQSGTLCLESEWHRFPSHFLVPDTIKIGFLKHSFDGIMPLYFNTTHSSTPMNDMNKEMPQQYTPIEQCTYVMALNDYSDFQGYAKYFCAPFLDAKQSGLARLFWVPESWLKRRYVDYCLYVKK
jgi:alpha-1,2-mannosyltransferase